MASNIAIQHANAAAAAAEKIDSSKMKPPYFTPLATPISSMRPRTHEQEASSSSKKRKRISVTHLMQQNVASELETGQKGWPVRRTALVEHYRLNYVLPEKYVPVMDDEITNLVSFGHKDWLPLAQRLTGWTKEVRVRDNTARRHDCFYYHGKKRFRTFRDVKRYIYLGYPPCEEKADKPLERLALNEPDPREEKIEELP